MHTKNTKAMLTAVSIGGKGNPVVTFTLAFELYLSEMGDGGFADLVFAAAPSVMAAMSKKGGSSSVTMMLQAEELFDGIKVHNFSLFGLPEDSRMPQAAPLVQTSAANVKGKCTFKLDFGDGDGNVAAKLVMPVKAPASEIPELTIREIGTQLHGECYVDLEPVQVTTDEVEPTNRGNPADPDRQGDLALPDAAPEDVPAEDDSTGDTMALEMGGLHVILSGVPDHAFAVARLLRRLAIEQEHIANIISDVKDGQEWMIVSDISAASAGAVVAQFEACGATAHVCDDIAHRVQDDSNGDAAGDASEDAQQPESAAGEETTDAGDDENTEPESTEEGEVSELPYEDPVDAMPDDLDPRDIGLWATQPMVNLAAMSHEALVSYLDGLDLKQLIAQHNKLTGKKTRSESLPFIRKSIIKAVAKHAA